ncbi:MAG: integrase arm-type DNA-binding domain-containing protein, partial [Rhodoplanes sp.]
MAGKGKGLTARKVETAKPGKYEDGNGLRLVVASTGARKWVFRYMRIVLLSQKAAGGGLENQIVEAIHEPARGLRWAWLMTVDRGLRRMSRGWQ